MIIHPTGLFLASGGNQHLSVRECDITAALARWGDNYSVSNGCAGSDVSSNYVVTVCQRRLCRQ
jgi:hypothetical protein